MGILTESDTVYKSFYEPLFRGVLSILMLIIGMEAWSRIVHELLGFGAGMIAHHLTSFSAGGVVLLAVMAASSSDISGPPIMLAAMPEANASAYVGTSMGLGSAVTILSIPLFIALAELMTGA